MTTVDKRFALVANNGDRLYPYKKKQLSTDRYGFALTAPGELDRHGGGNYTEDFALVVSKLVNDGWSVRAKTTDKRGRQREGSIGLCKQVIVGYEIDSSLQDLVATATLQPLKVL